MNTDTEGLFNVEAFVTEPTDRCIRGTCRLCDRLYFLDDTENGFDPEDDFDEDETVWFDGSDEAYEDFKNADLGS